jgi:hypothetical protein
MAARGFTILWSLKMLIENGGVGRRWAGMKWVVITVLRRIQGSEHSQVGTEWHLRAAF